jgi:molecular chaperone GrpE (heat shock protein)
MQWLNKLFNRQPADQRALALERELGRLRLALAEQEERAERLQAALARQQGDAGQQVSTAVAAQTEALLADAAAPVSQLLTQAHLLEVEGRAVQARDVLAVARRLVRLLEDHGLRVQGQVGQTVPFDPDRHEPLSAGAALKPGQPAVVRFVGIRYGERWLRKAGVEPAGSLAGIPDGEGD